MLGTDLKPRLQAHFSFAYVHTLILNILYSYVKSMYTHLDWRSTCLQFLFYLCMLTVEV